MSKELKTTNKTNKTIRKTISRTYVNHIKQMSSSWEEYLPCLGSQV